MDYLTKRVFKPNQPGYELSKLGSNIFKLENAMYVRTDDEFISSRKKRINYSVFTASGQKPENRLCLVYLTGNKGDRRSALFLRCHMLPNGIDIACFDYNGLGVSEYDFLSYSLHERHDLNIMVC